MKKWKTKNFCTRFLLKWSTPCIWRYIEYTSDLFLEIKLHNVIWLWTLNTSLEHNLAQHMNTFFKDGPLRFVKWICQHKVLISVSPLVEILYTPHGHLKWKINYWWSPLNSTALIITLNFKLWIYDKYRFVVHGPYKISQTSISLECNVRFFVKMKEVFLWIWDKSLDRKSNAKISRKSINLIIDR